MTDGSDEPHKLHNEGTASHLFGLLVRSKLAWVAVLAIVLVATIVPTIAKVPVALVLAAFLLVPLLRNLQVRPGIPDEPVTYRASTRGISFEGFKGEQGPKGTKWRQVRCVVEGSELRMSSFWHKGEVEVISIKDARIVGVSPSGVRDLNLKSGRMRILDLELVTLHTLRLAIDCSIEEPVRATLGECM